MFNFIPNRLALIVLISACSIILISMGLRQTFGLFFSAFEEGLGCTRTEFGLAIGIQMLFWGMFAPLFGLIADKLGGNKAVFIGFIIATTGVIIMTIKDVNFFIKNLFSKTTLVGLITGLFLGLSVVYFRAAALSLENISSNFEKALSTLFFGLLIQTFIITIYLFIFERSEFKKLYNNKVECCMAGLSGFLATLSWFYAFTLIQSSFVRALGQIEILFSFASSKYLFKEKLSKIELFGILIFISGVSMMLLTRTS